MIIINKEIKVFQFLNCGRVARGIHIHRESKTAEFQELLSAYHVLKIPQSKASYDLESGRSSGGGGDGLHCKDGSLDMHCVTNRGMNKYG